MGMSRVVIVFGNLVICLNYQKYNYFINYFLQLITRQDKCVQLKASLKNTKQKWINSEIRSMLFSTMTKSDNW